MKTSNDLVKVINHLTEKHLRKDCLNILDVGCGAGDLVGNFLSQNYNAYGCDVTFKSGSQTNKLIDTNRIKKIIYNGNSREDVKKNNPLYSYPFADSYFDVLYSRAVVEHVFNLDEFIQENLRVLKTGGIAIHYFPSKWSIIESHTGILFGAASQNLIYYKFMCSLGFCFSKYKNKGHDALNYMKNSTHYESNRSIRDAFNKAGLQLIEEPNYLILRYFHKGRFYKLSERPFKNVVNLLWSCFRSPLMVFKKTSDPQDD